MRATIVQRFIKIRQGAMIIKLIYALIVLLVIDNG